MGFDFQHLPDKKWIVDVLYSKKPNDEIFQKISIPVERTIPKE